MSTLEMVLNYPLTMRLDDDELEDGEGDVDEEWGADISIGDEDEEEEVKKKSGEEEEEDDKEDEEEDEDEE